MFDTTFYLSRNSACPSCALSSWTVFLTVDLLLRVLCPDLPNRSTLTEHTSDNQRLGTSNDTTYVAEHPMQKSKLD